jgi:homoprotocatechuate degradation regulator HpaR
MTSKRRLAPYRQSLAGVLLAAREAVMAPIRPMLRDAGVTEQQWRVLRALLDEGPIDPSRLAQSALLFPASITRILRELAERGLIQREADPKDGRRSIVAISPSGEALVQQTAGHTLQMLDIYAARFGPDRLQALMSELRDLTASIAPLGEDAEDSRADAPGD